MKNVCIYHFLIHRILWMPVFISTSMVFTCMLILFEINAFWIVGICIIAFFARDYPKYDIKMSTSVLCLTIHPISKAVDAGWGVIFIMLTDEMHWFSWISWSLYRCRTTIWRRRALQINFINEFPPKFLQVWLS